MTPEVRFTLLAIVTVALLAAAVAAGLRARRRLHVTLVATALASLGLTIWQAVRMGELYDLAAAGAITPVHLTLAKLTAVAYLLPIATGLRTWRHPSAKRWHRKVAFLALGMTALAIVTGVWMMLAAERLPIAAP